MSMRALESMTTIEEIVWIIIMIWGFYYGIYNIIMDIYFYSKNGFNMNIDNELSPIKNFPFSSEKSKYEFSIGIQRLLLGCFNSGFFVVAVDALFVKNS